MRINGEWHSCPDGVTRPTIQVRVEGADGQFYLDRFLIDSGADSTVFTAAFLTRLQWPGFAPPSSTSLQGVGGSSPYVLVASVLELVRDDGGVARIRGTFAAFTNPMAADMSILGRDVLDHFDLILSRQRNDALLLSQHHKYTVLGP